MARLEEIKYILQAKMNLVKVVLYFYLILKVLENDLFSKKYLLGFYSKLPNMKDDF